MINHVIIIVLPSKNARGIFLRWLNSHHALSGYNKGYIVMFIYYL